MTLLKLESFFYMQRDAHSFFNSKCSIIFQSLLLVQEIIFTHTSSFAFSISKRIYPPSNKHRLENKRPSHSNTTRLTLIFQVSEVQGQQIKKNNNGHPLMTKPIHGVIIDIGDIMEVTDHNKIIT